MCVNYSLFHIFKNFFKNFFLFLSLCYNNYFFCYFVTFFISPQLFLMNFWLWVFFFKLIHVIVIFPGFLLLCTFWSCHILFPDFFFTTILAFLMLFFPHEFVLTKFKHFVNSFSITHLHVTTDWSGVRFLLHWLKHSYVPFVQIYLKN